MAETSLSSTTNSETFIVSLDIGSTSVRTLLYDQRAAMVPGFGHQAKYRPIDTEDGGWEVDPEKLFRASATCLSNIHKQLAAAGKRPAGVAVCAFWHSFHGIDRQGKPSTRIIHLFDTRSAEQVRRLKVMTSEAEAHSRTGCVFHTSYWPSKLLWLHENRADAFARTTRWISFGEYLFLRILGVPASSTSMVSASGIWNQNSASYDEKMLSLLPIREDQLCGVEELDHAPERLLPKYRALWPLFDGIPWFPALGDGACNNVGSGCVTPERFALMVGTSGALRAVVERDTIGVPAGVWCYRVDRRRFVLGGALSNGGFVYDKMRRLLKLPAPAKLEAELAGMTPGAHKLTVLPFFNGERSTKWNPDARAAFAGMSHITRPEDLLRAAMESVALRFRLVYGKLAQAVGEPVDVVATGSALDHSPAWTQMMADALGRPVLMCGARETSSRGAAMLALERLGAIPSITAIETPSRARFEPVTAYGPVYDELMHRQNHLYKKLFEES
jgi:gluconokinase